MPISSSAIITSALSLDRLLTVGVYCTPPSLPSVLADVVFFLGVRERDFCGLTNRDRLYIVNCFIFGVDHVEYSFVVRIIG